MRARAQADTRERDGSEMMLASRTALVVVLGVWALLVWAAPAHAQNSIVAVDAPGPPVLQHTSLALDRNGNPVISYFDEAYGDLKLVHCNDPNCAGGDESPVTVDSAGNVGLFTSLALDASGNPVISYQDGSRNQLKLAHCNDPNCVGGGESIVIVRASSLFAAGEYTSLELDANGYPVVSLRGGVFGRLLLLHCNDPNCAGDDDSVRGVDDADGGLFTSLELDATGNPVISYYGNFTGDLKLAHCNDPDCAGGDESVVAVDTAGDVGRHTSLALDGAGNPVLTYLDSSNRDLKLAHCNDPNCLGGDEFFVTLDADVPGQPEDVPGDPSLALDGNGNPVVSYYSATNGDLRLVRCRDVNCVDGTNVPVDVAGDTGHYTSVAVDGIGNPVVSYFDASNSSLKLAHCNDTNCLGGDESSVTVDTVARVGEYTSLALDGAGNPVISYLDRTNGDLRLAHCNDRNCGGGDDSVVAVDTAGAVGFDTSLALDRAGNPVISYYHGTNGDLKLAHCNDPDCAGGDESVVAVDTAGDVGRQTSLALDGAGNPVISYLDGTNLDLKLAHCNDPDCGGGDESVVAVDTAGAVGFDTSLALDGAGNPVISYYDDSNFDLKLAHCGTTTCAPNRSPNAADDAYATDEDAPLSVAAPGVLDNDSDPEGDDLRADLVSAPAHGTLTLNDNGSFTYAPNADFNGGDSFTYRASDGNLESDVATVTIAVRPVNDAPKAADDAFATDEDTPLSVVAPGVLGNDADADGDTLTAALVSGPSHGNLSLNANGSFTYTPAADFNGSDSFTYRASDGDLESNVATVEITVRAVADAPSAADDAYATDEDTPLSVVAPGVLGNDADADGDTLTAALVSGPSHGNLSLNANGSFTYTPDAEFIGSDSFTYRASDGDLDSNVATVEITVAAVNDAPTVAVAAGGVCGGDDRSGTINLTLADVDSPAASLTLTASSSNQSLVPDANVSFAGAAAERTLTATTVAGRTGTAVLTVSVSDGQATGSVTVTLQAGGNGAQTLDGGAGADILLGQNGGDTLEGNAGNDLLCGGNGGDTMNGGPGDDTLAGGNGPDRFSGGPGTDSAADLTPSEGDTQDGTIP
jgi:VCBS repeat-containing protein